MSDDLDGEDDRDPLEGADIGETRTVRESVDLHPTNFSPDVFYGSDRMGRPEIAEIEVTENEYGDEKITVTFEADMTKRLPRRWDYSKQPRTETEEKRQRRNKWLKRVAHATPVVVVLGISLFVTDWFMQQMAANMTINGEPVAALGMAELGFAAVVILFLTWAIRVLPGKVGSRRGWSI